MKKNNSRPIIVYASPRSGSTLAYAQIEKIVRSHNYVGLQEYFNPYVWGYSVKRNKIKKLEGPALYSSWNLSETERKKIWDARLLSLRKAEGPYILKVLSTQYRQDSWLEDKCDWIFVERRNLFEQFLSFSVSVVSGKWYVEGGIKLPVKCLVAPPDLIKAFEWRQRKYFKIKTRMGNECPVLIYENFSKVSDLRIIARDCRLTRQRDDHAVNSQREIHIPKKQNIGNKLRYFKNQKTLVDSYKGSWLYEIFSDDTRLSEA